MNNRFLAQLGRRWRREESRTVFDLTVRIIVPGFMLLYLVTTEDTFLSEFNNDFPVQFFGEVAFLSMHLMFTYVVLPLVWFSELADFLWRDSDVPYVVNVFYKMVAGTCYWLLIIAVAIRILMGY